MDKVSRHLSRKIISKNSIVFETSNLAKLADGACTCSLGHTSVLVTAVCKEPQRQASLSYVPLTVDYRQKAAAAGRIPMTHLRRDIGVTEKETLVGRMIDRSIRPAFGKGFRLDTQIFCDLLAVDGLNEPDILAINGAAASLSLSDIPWNGPVGAVRVGFIGDNLVINPSRREQQNSRLNLVISANSHGNLLMMDGSCKEPMSINDMMRAIKHGIKECQFVTESISKLVRHFGKPKRKLNLSLVPEEKHINLSTSLAQPKIKSIFMDYSLDKVSRDEAIKVVLKETTESVREIFPDVDQSILVEAFGHAVRRIYKQVLIETKIRCDGRSFDELRPIHCEVDLYKPLHGSAIFQRGQTQVFCSATFDSVDAAVRTDSMTMLMNGIKEKNFMLHYEFPPFATNDIGKIFTLPGRREIGHGALAENSILPLVPELSDMTLRLNCEVLESNGSSSMASVCAGSLSLMDAGVDIKEHVAGVAMGLIDDTDEQPYRTKSETRTNITEPFILTDILGFEDFIGDMDFKIAGTKKALTGIQLDVKPMTGVHISIVQKALQKAHVARAAIINKMEQAIKEPRKVKKENHPVIKYIQVPPHKRSKFIGFGGSNLKKLIAQIGVRVSECPGENTENSNQVGAAPRDTFVIFAPNKDAMEEAEEFIKTVLEKEYKEPELEFNGIYTATIQEVRSNGVMITLYPQMQPTLLPLSQLDIRSVVHPSVLNLEVGQEIQVKYFGRDPASGQMRLSRKSLLMSGVNRVHSIDSKHERKPNNMQQLD